MDEDQLVQSLEILKENNLPRADYENLGKVFSGQGMISSASEEQARMAYAISQELSDTFSRIDGVLTAASMWCSEARIRPPIRVPCLPPPFSSAIPRIRLSSTWSPKSVSLRPRAVPDLDYERVSVMLVPVREQVSVPMEPTPKFLGLAGSHRERAAICLDRRGDRLLAALAGLALLGAFPA